MAIVTGSDLTARDRALLFWASFLALAAAGFGFAFRVAMQGDYGLEFELTEQQVGEVFGASLWPIAITMIGFSLVVDKTGYKLPMYGAFALQVISGVGTFMAANYTQLYIFALCAGLGHGIVEAVINPMCAAVYPKKKTLWLTLLHAAWPAGLVAGTLLVIGSSNFVDGWRMHALWIVIPALVYAAMYLPCKFPVDERVRAGVPYMEMLRQIGFLSAALAGFMMTYEIGNQLFNLTSLERPDAWFTISLGIGLGIGVAFGALVRSLGKPLFFVLCLLMIPIATAELGTDGWIGKLMRPVLSGEGVDPRLALAFSAGIMLFFRVFAGGVLKFFSPPVILCLSGIFSATGLFWLSGATGAAIFIAFMLYAIGQTYYWPCMLGFVAERYPQGGAMTLNTVSAIGLLSAGIIAFPILGVAFDKSIHAKVSDEAPALVEAAPGTGHFMWLSHDNINPEAANTYIASLEGDEQERVQSVYTDAGDTAGRDVLKFAVWFPGILLVVFGAIAVWFKTQGGYKPVELPSMDE